VTCNKILYSLNKPDDFILALVELDDGSQRVHYVACLGFVENQILEVASVNYSFAESIVKTEVLS
jgi:hypothetical protein